MKAVKIFFTLLGVGILCSAVPLGYLGLVFGFPSVLLNSVLLTFLYNKSKK